jgi:hypothetical protein
MVAPPLQPPSRVDEHDSCTDCLTFRSWLLARDLSERALRTPSTPGEMSALHGLSWLRDYYEWGPTQWPAHWCDFLTADKLDCGALANVTALVLNHRAIRTDRLQIIELATPAETAHWETVWREAGVPATEWILDACAVYHEGLVVHTRQGVVLYDTTNFTPVEGGPARSGVPLWLRFCPQTSQEPITWDGIDLPPHEWINVRSADADLAPSTC